MNYTQFASYKKILTLCKQNCWVYKSLIDQRIMDYTSNSSLVDNQIEAMKGLYEGIGGTLLFLPQ